MSNITINGQDYTLDQLSAAQRGTVTSIQFADQRIKELQDEMAIHQTAINAYAQSLGQKMPKEAMPNAKDEVVTINNKTYVLSDFEGEAQELVFSIHKAQKCKAKLEGDLALARTARSAYANELSAAL